MVTYSASLAVIPRTFYIAAEARSQIVTVRRLTRWLIQQGWINRFDWANLPAAIRKPYRVHSENIIASHLMMEAAGLSQLFIYIVDGDPHGGKMEFGAARFVAGHCPEKRIVLFGTQGRDSIFFSEPAQGHIVCHASFKAFRVWFNNEFVP